MPPIHIFLRTNTDFIHRWQIHLFYTFNYRWLASKLPILYSIIDEFPIDGTEKNHQSCWESYLFWVAKWKCVASRISQWPRNDPKRLQDPMSPDWMMVRFFSLQKIPVETSRNLWSHISLYPMIMGFWFSHPEKNPMIPKKSHDHPMIETDDPRFSPLPRFPGQRFLQPRPSRYHGAHRGRVVGSGAPAPDPIDSGGVASRRWRWQPSGVDFTQEIWWSVAVFVGTSIQLV